MASPTAPLMEAPEKMSFREELRLQRWDDHRYYHQSRVNQSLHFVSSICFITSYVFIFVSPGVAVMIGWLLAMLTRQSGHFFFEPKSFDQVNGTTHEHKESIKVGYNLQRKRVLHAVWAATPVVLYFDPSMLGTMAPARNFGEYMHNLAMLWLYVAMGALLFRMVQLFFSRNVQTGLVWATKILTDPFHDFKIYKAAPVALMKGEKMDPMLYVREELAGASTVTGSGSAGKQPAAEDLS